MFCHRNVLMKGNLAKKVYSTNTGKFQRMEEIVGVVVEEIDVCHERFLDD